MRKKIAGIYNNSFKDLPVKSTCKTDGFNKHGLCFYAVLLDLKNIKADRRAIQQALLAENIGSAVHFYPMHIQPYYAKKYGYKKGDFPHSEKFYERTLSLPMATGMTEEDIEDVIKAVRKVVGYYS